MTAITAGRTKVLASIEWFTPAFQAGGIVSSLANQVHHLSQDLEFWIVCSNRDLMGPLEGEPKTGIWHNKGSHHVMYVAGPVSWNGIIKEVNPDAIYINGVFNGPFCRSLIKFSNTTTIPTVLAAHGMLAPNAIAIKAWVKKPWLNLHKFIGTFRRVKWHASSASEARQIKHWFNHGHVRIAQNLPPAMANEVNVPKPGLRFLSVGRIHPIKNYAFAAQCLAALALELNQNITYQIIGPIEDKAEHSAIQFNQNKLLTIDFLGEKSPPELPSFYQDAQCLLVPSLTENFGVVIAEALGNGLPVIVSDQTPWGTFPHSPAMHCLPLDMKLWLPVMASIADIEVRKEAVFHAQEFFLSHLLKPEIRQHHLDLFS